MSSEVTDKTYVIVSKMAGDFWITEKQADSVMVLKNSDPNSHVVIDDSMISCFSIDAILTAEKYAELNIRRRGGWQCKYGNWHERGQQCAHGGMRF